MDANRLKLMSLLEMLADDGNHSQRDLSKSLNISLGLVNSFIKQLVKEGYCIVKSLPNKRLRYSLTPSGMVQKTRLFYDYISFSYHHFKTVRHRLQQFFGDLEKEGINRVIFCGTGELCDIAAKAIPGTNIYLVDVVHTSQSTEHTASLPAKSLSRLRRNDFDIVLVTAPGDHKKVVDSIENAGISKNKIRFID